ELAQRHRAALVRALHAPLRPARGAPPVSIGERALYAAHPRPHPQELARALQLAAARRRGGAAVPHRPHLQGRADAHRSAKRGGRPSSREGGRGRRPSAPGRFVPQVEAAPICPCQMKRRGGDTSEVGREGLAPLDAVYTLARRWTGSDSEAENLVQETYARAFAAAPSFAPGTNLRARLFQILGNARKPGIVAKADADDGRGDAPAGEGWARGGEGRP